jgi:hypothetical protein
VGASTEVLTGVVAKSVAARGGSSTAPGGYAESLRSTRPGPGVSADLMQAGPVPVDSHFGNRVVHAAPGRTCGNCLLATKVVIRANTDVSGSNSFEIPRSAQLGARPAHVERGRRLRAVALRNHYDIAGSGLFLVARWFVFHVISFALLFGIFCLVTVGRAVSHFRSISDSYFWWHEHFWKPAGMPFANVGARVFDDSWPIIEKAFTAVGGSRLQSHSQEGGTVESDHITIDAGCMIGLGSLVHYRVPMGGGAALTPDSFLMKGEDASPYARWGGNPAREIDDNRATAKVGGK